MMWNPFEGMVWVFKFIIDMLFNVYEKRRFLGYKIYILQKQSEMLLDWGDNLVYARDQGLNGVTLV